MPWWVYLAENVVALLVVAALVLWADGYWKWMALLPILCVNQVTYRRVAEGAGQGPAPNNPEAE